MTRNRDPRRPTSSLSAVQRVSEELRTLALAVEAGAFLGSEVTLTRRLGVSAPTLRQAARLLEHEELVSVKRGIHGGYFSDRPDVETVSRVAATYLQGSLRSNDEAWLLIRALTPLITDLILQSGRVGELQPFATPEDVAAARDDFVDTEARFVRHLADLTGNTPIQMVLSIFFAVGTMTNPSVRDVSRTAVTRIQKARVELCRALLDSDRERAVASATEYKSLIYRGIARNLATMRRKGRAQKPKSPR